MAFLRSFTVGSIAVVVAACGPGSGNDGSGSGSGSGSDSNTDSASSTSGGTSGSTSGGSGSADGGTSTSGGAETGSSETGVAETGPGQDCDGQICVDDEFCNWIMNSCGSLRYDQASCDTRPTGCDDDYAPVCACDGQVYSNACAAEAAGLDLSDAGGCEPPDGMFPCGWLLCDSGNAYCQTTPTDAIPSPNAWSCVPVPNDCGESPSCDCIPVECFGGSCEQKADGTIVVTCPGG